MPSDRKLIALEKDIIERLKELTAIASKENFTDAKRYFWHGYRTALEDIWQTILKKKEKA
jgi:hypothetical protein